ncbi:MAG: phosphomannomutase [Anaerolineaceae bacterium]|jgi:phosphomannomutase|nr:phosphomannomutase [Anaerolineaceae bacterium]|tara:strand:- start:1493 stop:2917 length:1425 start_codon:yes stop_codon:yes gene_type:complete
MNPDTKIQFGTDGWRGQIANDYTFDNVRRCAQGYASHILEQGHSGESVVVGYDKRYASEHFARAVAEVLSANKLNVWLTNTATPTPVIAYAVIEKQAVGAINITASHNPPTDNGFKVRDHTGGAIAPDGLKNIESHIPTVSAVKSTITANTQELIQMFDPAPTYVEHLHEMVNIDALRNAGFHITVDAMWGNGAGWFTRLLNGGSTTIKEVHNIRNPIFPEMSRPEPIPPNIDAGLQTAIENGSDVCLITDGDADRLGLGDENGSFINQLRVFGLLAFYLLEVRGVHGPIVKTISTTSLLNKLGQIYEVPVYETGVGFKFVAPKMTETNAIIGGEESGGFAFQNHVPERDGILAGLYILDLMRLLDQKPSELLGTLFAKTGTESHYDRIDSTFPSDQKEQIIDRVKSANPSTIGGLTLIDVDTTDGFKFNLDGGDWLLIRFSGTEPIIRVYCETTDADRVQQILQDGLSIAGLS